MTTTILPVTYLGNILYYAHLISRPCIIDIHSNYTRQTYANRTTIVSSCGIQNLSIPVESSERKTHIAEINISTHSDWQQQHWRAMETAYRSTPFYQYYRDEIRPYYEQKWTNLASFDIKIQKLVLELLGYDNLSICISDSYISHVQTAPNDCREVINPKKFDVSLYRCLQEPYYQVFDNKFGFIPNTSIIDLLFNLGNEARLYLNKISKQLYPQLKF